MQISYSAHYTVLMHYILNKLTEYDRSTPPTDHSTPSFTLDYEILKYAHRLLCHLLRVGERVRVKIFLLRL